MLVLDGLGIAPVGRTYQAWVLTTKARPAAPLSGALLAMRIPGVRGLPETIFAG